MRAVEFIRELLDLLDNMDKQEPETGVDNHMASVEELIPDTECMNYANEPGEKYANIHAVSTSAGGGVNGPKHSADLRGSSVNIYPRGE